MKKAIRAGVALAALAAVCIGCGKKEPSAPEAANEKPQAENWEPESVKLPEGHSADDGHDHSAHGHAGHDHSGHNH